MLAIIPARGGSKGIRGKNIKPLGGRPLIAYSIEAAQKSDLIERLIVSTDDEDIAEVSIKYGAEIPFLRPARLAKDDSLAIDNYIYTVDRLNNETTANYEAFIVLQPTSPFRTSDDINSAIELFHEMNADSVISVCESTHPPIWSKKIDENGCLKEYFDLKTENKNRQDYIKAYFPNGAIYIFRLPILKRTYSYYTNNTLPYIMPPEKSLDIDRSIDIEFAEFLMRKNGIFK